ncbi:alpha/beta hydrolase [Cohnella faecalis]|uniref:alpha/beta hydrolase n=1 Tax=Cohnella faecalis TaxID=2315694 RepID=UPI001EEBA965|nr:alpha/beta hydrolase-fold protein [Cohnella faecalis]
MLSNIVRFERFRSTLLNNERTVYVYMPPNYDRDESSRFPVLYVQDGQHAFQEDESGGSWDLHLIADRLISEGRVRPFIIVAVAHVSDSRIAEYMHAFPGNEKALGTESRGERYEQFLIEEVKPLIDRTFRTLTGPEHTAVMGSSAGGLVSYNLGFRRPDVFGMVGAFCPYFVVIDQDGRETWIGQFHKEKPPIRLWMDVGEAEGYTVLEKHVRSAVDTSLEAGFVRATTYGTTMCRAPATTRRIGRPECMLRFFISSEMSEVQSAWSLTGRNPSV